MKLSSIVIVILYSLFVNLGVDAYELTVYSVQFSLNLCYIMLRNVM